MEKRSKNGPRGGHMVGKRIRRLQGIALALLLLGLTGSAAIAQDATAPAGSADLSGQLTLWHGWTGTEAETLNKDIVPAWEAAYPNVELEILAVPFGELQNKYSTEASTGSGPDLLIG